MKKTKILLFGCMGRLGTAISNVAAASTNVEIVAGFETYNLKEKRSYPVFNRADKFPEADAAILAFGPTASAEIKASSGYCATMGVPLVICTTGMDMMMDLFIQESASKIPVFVSPNMSLGVNLLENILSRSAKLLYNSNFDIEIVEKHHNKKLDAPSGTAVRMAQVINNALGQNMHIVTNRSEEQKERERNEIGVSAVRGGNIIGEHSVIFAGQSETIEIKHTAQSRDVFAEGALQAAKFICGMPPGLYDMQDLINKM